MIQFLIKVNAADALFLFTPGYVFIFFCFNHTFIKKILIKRTFSKESSKYWFEKINKKKNLNYKT